MRRIACWGLVVATLVASVGWAAGQKDAAAVDTSGPKPKVVLMWSDGISPPKGRMLDYVGEKFHADYEILVIPIADYTNRLSLAMASGELADLIQVRTPVGDGARLNRELIDGDLVLPLDPYLGKYPFLKTYLEVPEAKRFSMWDGKHYVVPKKYFYHNQLTYYRQDLYDKYKLQLPKTVDEYFNTMKIISQGEGIPATTAQRHNSGATRILLGAFNRLGGGVLPRWKWQGDKYVDVTIEPETREGLRYLNKLYAAGLLDKEYMLLTDTSKYIEKFMTGKVVSLFINIEQTWWDQLYPITEKNIPGAKVKATLPPVGPSGDFDGSVVSPYGTVDMLLWKKSKNPDKVLALWNFLFSPEGEMFNKYGIQGVHWTKDSSGKVIQNQAEIAKDTTGPADAISKFRWLSDILPGYYNGTRDPEYRDQLLAAGQKRGTSPWVVGFTSRTLQKVLPTLNQLEAEYFDKFITGALSLDKDWDGFVKTWRESGLNDLEKEVNEYVKTPNGKAKSIQNQ
jgi:putative aldouronate transport system substrate-binding protein